MKNRYYSFILILLITGSSAFGQVITLYSNDFESPNITPTENCGPDLDATDTNTLWSGTGGGTGGGGSFQQVNTVETILINGPSNQYEDPAGTGGNYCLSMLSGFQDDKAALTLNSQGLPFAIVSFDLSAIDIASCGGPIGLDTAIMNVKIYDSPGAVFDFYLPGTLLDEDTLTGVAPGATPYTFNWSAQLASMDIANSVDGNITVVFDLLQSGYAAIDNLLIQSSISDVAPVASFNFIEVIPNPASEVVHVQGLGNTSATIVISDVWGRIVTRIECREGGGVDISELAAGHYFVAVPGMAGMKKLVVM